MALTQMRVGETDPHTGMKLYGWLSNGPKVVYVAHADSYVRCLKQGWTPCPDPRVPQPTEPELSAAEKRIAELEAELAKFRAAPAAPAAPEPQGPTMPLEPVEMLPTELPEPKHTDPRTESLIKARAAKAEKGAKAVADV